MNFRKMPKTKVKWRDFRTLQKRLYHHVNVLSNEIGPRNPIHYSALNEARQYIVEQMTLVKSNFTLQQYRYEKKLFQNLVVEKIGENIPEEILIVGAHYDSVMDSPGADDNATGIASLLEIIRLLQNYVNQRTLRFVAFTLEEPPFFGTEQMGSHVYARSCREKNENIVGMVALEMLGFYTERKKSQKYPSYDMKDHYSDKGNFIAIVGNEDSYQLTINFAEYLKQTSLIKTETIIPYSQIHGIDLSDHSSFWKFQYPAIMITDTAFYRNPHYHEVSDTIVTINFRYFARLVFSLAYALKKLDQRDMI